MKKRLQILVLMIVIVFAFAPLQAQKLIKKELKTENNKYDGMEYQWYLYTYKSENETYEAAFDLEGNRITPNGYKPDRLMTGAPRIELSGVTYCGGGLFSIYSKKKDAFGHYLQSAYSLNGTCVFPLSKYTSFIYMGNGLFSLASWIALSHCVDGVYKLDGQCIISEDNGFDFFQIKDVYIIAQSVRNKKYAVYDLKGNTIISESLGYNWIAYYEEYGCFWCESGDVKHTFSKDGKYYAIGYYSGDEKEKFEKSKKPITTLSSENFSNTIMETPQPTPQPQPQPQPVPPQPQPFQVWKTCFMCGGSGQCPYCYGYGWAANGKDACGICHGTGKCSQCAGHGGHNEIEYH